MSSFDNLEYLKCEKCVLTADSFAGLARLKRLDLDNTLHNEKCQKDLFRHVPQLECLVLADSLMSENVDFSCLVNLKQLEIYTTHIFIDHLKILETLSPRNLAVIKIRDYRLQKNCFNECLRVISKRLINLRLLDIGPILSISASSRLEIDCLSVLRDLRELKIEWFILENINLNLSSMSMLHLERLCITETLCELRPGVFRNLSSLKSLRIEKVMVLDENVFENLVNLEHLSLTMSEQQREQTDLTQAKLAGLVALKRLRFDAPASKDIEPSVFASMPNLESVCLSSSVSQESQRRLQEAHQGRIKFRFKKYRVKYNFLRYYFNNCNFDSLI